MKYASESPTTNNHLIHISRTTITQLYLAGALSAITIYALLPTLINGWTFPPGPDPHIHQQWLEGFPQSLRYYGHLPALLIGITTYFYITPVITFLGFWAYTHERYSWWVPVFAWTTLWLIVRSPIMSMESGQHVEVVALYGLGPIFLRLLDDKRWMLAIALGSILTLAHTYSGLLMAAGTLGFGLIRDRLVLVCVLAMCIAMMFIAFTSDSSLEMIWRIGRWYQIVNTPSGERLPVEPLGLAKFGKWWLGYGGLAFWSISIMIWVHAYSRGYRPKWGALQIVFVTLIPILVLMTFTPLQINSDRAAKVLVNLVSLLFVFEIAHILIWRKSRALTVATSSFIGIIGLVHGIEATIHWVSLGVRL